MHMGGAVRTFTIQLVSRLVGLVAALRGWMESNDLDIHQAEQTNRLVTIWEETTRGVRQTWMERVEGEKKRKSIYSTLILFAWLGMLNNAMLLRSTPHKLHFHQSLYVCAIARLSLVSTVASVLKDAALRGTIHLRSFTILKYILCV